MIITDLFSSKDSCPVCGQTPCNCTSIKESIHDEDCHLCKGTGEGLFDGESCPVCDGTGIEPKSRNDDDFVEPDDYDDADYGDEESYYEKSLRNRGLGEQGVAEDIDRRGLLKGLGAAAVGSIFGLKPGISTAELSAPQYAKVFAEGAGSCRLLARILKGDRLETELSQTAEKAEKFSHFIAQQNNLGANFTQETEASFIRDISPMYKENREQFMGLITTSCKVTKMYMDKLGVKESVEQGVAEGQQWPDSSNSLAKRSAVATNLKGAPSKAGRSSGMTVATRVDPTITPTTVKKLGGERPVPSFLQKEGEQQKGADYRDPKEANYGDDYQDMVARVKKLAGLGQLKTQYDPNKRVYRNMPTAVQPKK